MTRRIPLFLRCSKRDIAHIAGRSQAKIFPAGEALVTEGDEGRDFFVVLDGRVEVTRGGSVLRELGRGDFFGEIAILTGGPRTATVTALAVVDALVVDETAMRALLSEMPALRRKVAAALAERLETTGV